LNKEDIGFQINTDIHLAVHVYNIMQPWPA